MRFTLSTKLILGFGFMFLMLLMSSSLGFLGVTRLSNSLEFLTGPAWDTADGAMESVIGIQQQVIAGDRFVRGDIDDRAYRNVIKETMQSINGAWGRLAAAALIDQTMVSQFDDALKAFTRASDRLSMDDRASVDAFHRTADHLLVLAAGFEEAGDQAVENELPVIQSVVSRTYLLVGLAALIGAVLAIVAFWIIRTSVIKPIQRLVERVEDIAKGHGDLSVQLEVQGDDELARLSEGFNQFVGKIRVLVVDTQEVVKHIKGTATSLSRLSADTARLITEQDQETGQVATAMTEMVATVSEVASNATGAANAARSADEQSRNGCNIVTSSTQAIDKLAEEVVSAGETINRVQGHSDEIGSILDVIRGIAEQTNLLALNAAIEAARAGDQGRGFAVVADEVRTLAQRTQQSTEEIQEMIGKLQSGTKDSVEAMNLGKSQAKISVEEARRAGEALASITDAVGIITDMNAQIAGAAEEQAAVAEEVNRNVNRISDIASQTSEGARKIDEDTVSLANAAERLEQLSAQFKT